MTFTAIHPTQTVLRTITNDDLAAEISKNVGTRIVTIITRTDARLRKRGNPYAGNVEVVQALNGVLNYDYEEAVNRRRGREDKPADFHAQPRAWGRRIEGTPIVEHKGRTYLSMKVERCLWRRFEQAETGRRIDPAEVEEFMPHRTSDRQGLQRGVVERSIALDSIVSIRMGGVTYLLRD